MIKIEAVTVCVNYSKYFKFCIPRNKKHFSRWVVVTTSKDEETIALCKQHNLEVVLFDGFSDENGPFQKSKGINMGLRRLKYDWSSVETGMILHIDADIVLPGNFSERINSKDLRVDHFNLTNFCPRTLYGVNRCNLDDPITDEKIDELFSIMAKYKLSGTGAKLALGYFQLFLKESIRVHHLHKTKMIYPEFSRNASFDDCAFSKLFTTVRGIELTVIHLGESYKNWNGI